MWLLLIVLCIWALSFFPLILGHEFIRYRNLFESVEKWDCGKAYKDFCRLMFLWILRNGCLYFAVCIFSKRYFGANITDNTIFDTYFILIVILVNRYAKLFVIIFKNLDFNNFNLWNAWKCWSGKRYLGKQILYNQVSRRKDLISIIISTLIGSISFIVIFLFGIVLSKAPQQIDTNEKMEILNILTVEFQPIIFVNVAIACILLLIYYILNYIVLILLDKYVDEKEDYEY